ncbi:hypothetical protein QT381_15335 [Galbitalea sp. SE-J8]|nr:hypothetical protein [Galbitalea sp. SE-J8]MDM4764373.1 hypothetical protein [Galbitalea sp. SE-J8]
MQIQAAVLAAGLANEKVASHSQINPTTNGLTAMAFTHRSDG